MIAIRPPPPAIILLLLGLTSAALAQDMGRSPPPTSEDGYAGSAPDPLVATTMLTSGADPAATSTSTSASTATATATPVATSTDPAADPAADPAPAFWGYSLSLTRDGVPPDCGPDSTLRSFRARRVVPGSSGTGWGYRMTYELGPGRDVEIYSSPQDWELSVASIGYGGDILITESERDFLLNLADQLEDVNGTDIDLDVVDALDSQAVRATRLLSEWPGNLPIAFVCDPAAEMAHQGNRSNHTLPHDCPPVNGTFARVGGVSGHLEIEHSHRLRRLADGDRPSSASYSYSSSSDRRRLFHDSDNTTFTPICWALNSYYEVTHDDDIFERWDDASTYWAFLDMEPSCSDEPITSDGTWFFMPRYDWWECYDDYDPDHPRRIEYAHGNCFGRCARGCSGVMTQFTEDCADHDSCQRFGHGKWSVHCHDEFLRTIDDRMWAPNCIPVGPNPECHMAKLERDWENYDLEGGSMYMRERRDMRRKLNRGSEEREKPAKAEDREGAVW